MIISINGPERSGKDLFGVAMLCEPDFGFDIIEGFGNMHVETPYPWHYMKTRDLLAFMTAYMRTEKMNRVFYISEADKFLGPRGYTKEDQTEAVNGLSQGQKRENCLVYNFHPGDPDEPVKGVDIQLRSVTGIKFTVLHFLPPGFVHYEIKNVMLRLEPYEGLADCRKFMDRYDHKEHIK